MNSGARLKAFVSGTTKGSGKPTATAARSPKAGPAATDSNATATSKAPAQKAKAGGHYKFKSKTYCNGWRSEDRRYEFNGDGESRRSVLLGKLGRSKQRPYKVRNQKQRRLRRADGTPA